MRLPRITRIALAALAVGASIGLTSGCGSSDPALDLDARMADVHRAEWCVRHSDRACPVAP